MPDHAALKTTPPEARRPVAGAGWTGLLTLALASLGLGAAAHAEVDVTALVTEGTDMVPACSSCHGVDGLGDADVGAPMIAGMNAEYLAAMLAAFADGTRVGYTMNGIAPELSAEEMGALAAHYAAMPASSKDWEIDAAAAEAGGAIAHDGIVAAGVPGCVSCHGQNGEGTGGVFPRIAGQLPDYMTARIELWSTGEDEPDTPEEAIMARIATSAPADAMAEAIAYFAGLDPAAHFFCKGDVFEWLAAFHRQDRRFHGVILDPPTFSRNDKGKSFSAEKDYADLVALACGVLEEEAWMLCSGNTHKMPRAAFENAVREGVRRGRRILTGLESFPMPPEFQGEDYLKSVKISVA